MSEQPGAYPPPPNPPQPPSGRPRIGLIIGIGCGLIILLTILLVVVLVMIGQLGTNGANRQADARATANEMRRIVDSDDPTGLTVSGEGGPLQRVSATVLNGFIGDARAFQESAERAQLQQIISFEGLTRGSDALRDCGRFRGLADEARRYGARRQEHVDAGRRVAEEALSRGEIRQRDIDEFLAGAATTARDYDRQWALNAEIATLAADLCALLAEGRWEKSDDAVLFNDSADLARANGLLARIRSAGAEQERLRSQSRARATQSLDRAPR